MCVTSSHFNHLFEDILFENLKLFYLFKSLINENYLFRGSYHNRDGKCRQHGQGRPRDRDRHRPGVLISDQEVQKSLSQQLHQILGIRTVGIPITPLVIRCPHKFYPNYLILGVTVPKQFGYPNKLHVAKSSKMDFYHILSKQEGFCRGFRALQIQPFKILH